MRQEPELAHPFNRRPSRESVASTSSKVSSAEKAHAKSLRNAGKEAFLTVVRETVEELAVEAAAQALEDEEARTDGMHRRERSSGGGSSRSHRRSSSRASDRDLIPAQTIRPGVGPSQDSVSGSPFRPSSSSRSGGGGSSGGGGGGSGSGSRRSSSSRRGGGDVDEPSDRRRRRHRNTSIGQGEGNSIVASAMATFGGGGSGGGGGGDKPRSSKGHGHERAPSQASLAAAAAERAIALEEEEQTKASQNRSDANANAMEDDERETLLELLSGAYGQVNDLTDELKMSLDKLSDTEKELQALTRSKSNPQLLPKPSPTSDIQSPKDGDMDDADGAKSRKPVSKLLKGMFPSDEGAKSTPAAVRQLQMEVQRLRQRNAQAHAKEEKHKSDMSHMQRLMAVMESQINKADQDKLSAVASNGSSSRAAKQPPEGAYCMTPGGTRYQDGVTKPLVARVAELEEKLVQCSMENATAKQEHLTAKLNEQKLEKTLQKLRHELARSRAMNDLLQNEIDRLQGHDPEAEADGSGWRRWLGGVQEPLSPDPNPIQVNGDSDSPVVVVRDLDNNQLVYAPSRSQFT